MIWDFIFYVLQFMVKHNPDLLPVVQTILVWLIPLEDWSCKIIHTIHTCSPTSFG